MESLLLELIDVVYIGKRNIYKPAKPNPTTTLTNCTIAARCGGLRSMTGNWMGLDTPMYA